MFTYSSLKKKENLHLWDNRNYDIFYFFFNQNATSFIHVSQKSPPHKILRSIQNVVICIDFFQVANCFIEEQVW